MENDSDISCSVQFIFMPKFNATIVVLAQDVLRMHENAYCSVNDPVFEKRGILARVHEASNRFLFFRLLSAKMGTKIVRVATFSIYNP